MLLIVSAALVGACTATPAASSPAPSAVELTVLDHVAGTVAGLDAAFVAYKAGDFTKADDLVSDAYLDHFEFVEGPLDKIDEPLTDGLEQLIRDDLRAAITAHKPIVDVEAMIEKAKTDLATAASEA